MSHPVMLTLLCWHPCCVLLKVERKTIYKTAAYTSLIPLNMNYSMLVVLVISQNIFSEGGVDDEWEGEGGHGHSKTPIPH